MYLNKDILRDQTVVLNQEPEVSNDDEYKKKNDETLNEVDEGSDDKVDESGDEGSNDKVDEESMKREKE